MRGARVLAIDDEDDVRALLGELLSRAGYTVTAAANGREALRLFFAERPDVVLLDLNMPELDGWHTLERIRDLSDVPVVMLTARASELEKVRALQAGADDYVTKPFGRQELVARVDAVLRRARSSAPRGPDVYSDAFLEIDFSGRAVRVGDAAVALTPLEFRLLSAFVRHPDQVLSQDQLLELAWNDPAGQSPERVKLYVGYLRRKLEQAGARPSPIETVRGFGYRYATRSRPERRPGSP